MKKRALAVLGAIAIALSGGIKPAAAADYSNICHTATPGLCADQSRGLPGFVDVTSARQREAYFRCVAIIVSTGIPYWKAAKGIRDVVKGAGTVTLPAVLSCDLQAIRGN